MIYRFTQQEAEPLAMGQLSASACRSGSPRKRARILSELAGVHPDIRDGVELRALVCETDQFTLEGDILRVEGAAFQARLFSSYRPGDIEKIFLFIACAGIFEYEREPIFDVYADLWGSAYVDALLELLQRKLERECPPGPGFRLTRAFGPGFYGMTLQQVGQFFQLLPAGEIGVSLKGTLMVPLKSYTGMYLSLREGLSLSTRDCRDCIGNAAGCAYCRNRPPSSQGDSGITPSAEKGEDEP